MEVGALEVVLGIEAAEFLSGLDNAGKALTAFVGILADMGKEAVAAASEAQAVGTKLSGIFKEATPGVVRFSEELAKSAGRSTTEVEKMVSDFGQIAAPLVKNRELAASMSEELAAMAINMAKATHMSDQSAMEALSAGLRGSTRALREFGIDLSPTALKLEALKAGFGGASGAMNQAQLTLLRETVIMKSAADMAERAAQANGTFSEQTKELSAHTEELLEKIGGPLMAATASVLQVVNLLIQQFSNMSSGTATVIAASGALVIALAAIAAGIHLVEEGFLEEAAAAVAGWAAALGPALLVVAAIAGIGVAIGALIHLWQDHASAIKQAMGDAIAWVQDKFELLWEGIKSVLAAIRDGFFGAAEAIVEAMGSAFEWLQAKLGLFKDIQIHAAVEMAVKGMEGARQGLGQGGANASKLFAEGGKQLGEALSNAGHGLMDAFHYAIDGFRGLLPGGHAAADAPTAGPKGNLAQNLRALATPKDRDTGAGQSAQSDASAAWFAAQTAMGADTKKVAQAAIEVAQAEAEMAAQTSMAADAYLVTHKHSKEAADNAAAAAAASEDATTALAAAMQAYADRLTAEQAAYQKQQQMLQEFTNSIVSAVTPSSISKIEQGVSQGAAAGGPLGGLAGGAVAMLSQSKAFQSLMTQVNGIIQILLQAFTPFLQALKPLIGVVGQIVEVVGKILTPLFTLLGKMIEPLIQPLELVAQLLNALAPVITVIVNVVTALTPVFQILQVAMQAVDAVLKVVGSAILGIMIGLGTVWNAIVQAVQGFVNFFVNLINSALGWLGVHLNEADFSGAEVDINGFKDALHALWQTTDQSAQSAADLSAAQQDAAATTDTFNQALGAATESLTNVPQTFYNLINQLQWSGSPQQGAGAGAGAAGIPQFASGGRVTKPTLAIVGEGGEPENIIPDSQMGGEAGSVNVTIVSNDPDTIWQQLQPYFKQQGFLLKGAPYFGTVPRFLGA